MIAPPSKKVILLEFNELTPSLMDKFIEAGRLPNFKKFRDQATRYETLAAEVAPDLEPWIQWVTVHTGLNYKEHQLFHLNEGHKLAAPRIWDIVSRGGMRSLVFGSMNVNIQSDFNGLVLPDPWCTEVKPSEELSLLFKFIQKNVLEYSNDRVPLTKRDYLSVMNFLLKHGLSINTITRILKQLLEDRGGRFKWKRAVLLDKIQFDVFRWYWLRDKPSLSTFFANSTAHFQHSYWRNMDPDTFEVKPTNPKPDEYENAIAYGYEQMDELIGQFMKLADAQTTLVFSTALSQQPCLKYEATGGAFFHRARDFKQFLQFAGIDGFTEIAPVMTHQFHVDFPNETLARNAADILSKYIVNGEQLFQVEQKANRVFSGCRIYRAIDLSTPISNKDNTESAPLSRFFYRMETNKSGMHHPLGMLWVRDASSISNGSASMDHLELKRVPEVVLKAIGLNFTEYAGLDKSR
jgi:hypothetical protein